MVVTKREHAERHRRLQEQLQRMFARQKGRCHICNERMLPPPGRRDGGAQPARQCVRLRSDDRLSPERGQHYGEYRHFAACAACVTARAIERQDSIPVEIRRELARHDRDGERPKVPMPSEAAAAPQPEQHFKW